MSFIAKGQDEPIKLKYLGTAGWKITDGNITVLVDPYISRVKLGTGPGISPEDNRETFERSDYFVSDTVGIDSLISNADFILVHHSHFDHLSDVPYIANKTGAKVIGTETTCNILRAYGIPNEQLYPVKGGEDYQFDNFSVKVIPSIHSALNDKHYIDSKTYTEVPEAPLKVSDFIEGCSLMFLARFANHVVLTMGSMENKIYDYQHVSQRLQEENIRNDFEVIGLGTNSSILHGAELFFSFYIGDQNSFKNYIEESAINSDNKPIIEFSTIRIGVENASEGHLIAFFESEYEEDILSIQPKIKQDPGNEYSNHFLGLDLDMDHLAAKKLANNYQYSFKTEEELTVTDMKLQKFGIFEVDSLPFVIQTKPYYADEV